MVPSRTAALFADWRGDCPLDAGVVDAFKARHPSVAQAWGDDYAALDRALAAQDPWLGYSYWGPEATRLADGRDDIWLCGFLLWNIERFDARFRDLGLDAEFWLHFTDAFHGILDRIDADPAYATRQRDWYMKDLGLARGRLIPAVGRLLYPYTGLRLAHLFNSPEAAPYVYLRCGGRRPFFGLHVHQPMAKSYFNPDGWSECLRLATLALDAFPQVRGIMGASWFYDPAVAGISPHLAYLTEPTRRGAKLLRIGELPESVAGATATSHTRRLAYERGTYRPCTYALLWARQDMRATAAAAPLRTAA